MFQLFYTLFNSEFMSLFLKGLLFLVLIAFTQTNFAQPKGLLVGDKAPEFSVKAQNGTTIVLADLLKKGSVVLFFYRGSWCPYCNRQMAELQDSIQFIVGKGAAVVGVTPETDSSMTQIIDKSHASFPLIHDEKYSIMNSYGVSFKMDTVVFSKYKGYDLKLQKSNGNTDYILPVPATYVIGSDGLIKFVYFNTDYRKRVTVAELIKQL